MQLLTDKLEKYFGEISPNIVEENAQYRVCHLVDCNGVSGAYTMIFYTNSNSAFGKYIDAVKEIKKGALVGKTFRKHKAKLLKRNILKSKLKLSKKLKNSFQCNQDSAMSCLYNMSVVWENDLPIEFGMVYEIYSPKYKGNY